MTVTGWIVAAAFAVAAVVFFLLGIRYRKRVAEKEISSAEEEATRIINEAIKSSESKKREALLEAKEEILKNRSEYEREVKERRADLQKQESKRAGYDIPAESIYLTSGASSGVTGTVASTSAAR